MTNLENVARAICHTNGYAFVRRVGAGSFKETFEIGSPDETRQALKVFLPGFSPLRTKRELNAMVRCDHPNIGKLFSISDFPWQGETYLYVLEEFIPGGTLTSRLNAKGRFSPAEAQSLGVFLIDAVGHVASHDLVHRDLKPDNILLKADGTTPVIVDFGIVRDLADVSLTPTWPMRGPGTPLYASPEQLNNEKAYIDWRADEFSLGVVLSVSAFGFHPYEQPGFSSEQIVDQVAERQPRADRFFGAANSSRLEALIKMTEPWPAQRVRTPHLLADLWASQEVGMKEGT